MEPFAPPSSDVIPLRNAVVDVLTRVDDEVVVSLTVEKGAMTLVGAEEALSLYEMPDPETECSGGPAANTVVGAAMLGARTAFVGRVKDGQLGRIFVHDIRAAGVHFDAPPAKSGSDTAVCLVVVTPDAHRTICTHLGASIELGPDDVDEDLVRDSAVLYPEGYLWDPSGARAAMRKAIRTAAAVGRTVASSLSDPTCVDRHREDFLALVHDEVDMLFANEDELTSLLQTEDIDNALDRVARMVKVAACTRGEHGPVVVDGGERHVIPAEPVSQVVDTTGTGDLFAAGFLAGWTPGRNLHDCGRMGTIPAAEVIGYLGARPQRNVSATIARRIPA